MKIEVTLEGTNELKAAFAMVEKGATDLRELGTWKAVGSEFYKIEKEQFDSEGSGPSGKWKALSSGYAAIKAKKWGSVRILQASGRMYKSLTSKGGDSVFEETAQELTIGTSVSYAGFHQSGTRKMPKRPPIDLGQPQLDRLSKVIVGKMKQLAANARLRDVRGF
jgi:phage gpG-like protein